MISRSYSGVAGLIFWRINEYLEVLNGIFTLNRLARVKYCYLLYSSTYFKNNLDFF